MTRDKRAAGGDSITTDRRNTDSYPTNIEGLLEKQDQRLERLGGRLDAQTALLQIIAERLASIDEHIQGNANLLWRIEAALVVQRRRLDALDKSIAATFPSPESSGGP